jgi:hypothetical protein
MKKDGRRKGHTVSCNVDMLVEKVGQKWVIVVFVVKGVDMRQG